MFERLLVLYDQRLVGFLDRESDRISFTYTPEVVDAQFSRLGLNVQRYSHRLAQLALKSCQRCRKATRAVDRGAAAARLDAVL